MRGEPQSTVTERFDAMAEHYDVLEPWYEHLYARLHAILGRALAPPRAGRRRALDAGCGHGFQTERLAALGYEAHGVDLAAALLARARGRVPGATFTRGDITALPFARDTFDVVSCCGSTLSFVDDCDAALAELARVLRPGGRLLLECEHKWSLDLAWAMASALAGDRLGYGVSARAMREALAAPKRTPLRLPYPDYGTLTLFDGADLRRRLADVGLRWRRAWGVHAVTNVLPSTVLHRRRLPASLRALYRLLRVLDTAATRLPPARALANSLVVLAEKR
ncbi:MAG TPA: class I SAM-dependent methyltransferase [Terriglobales bacterium]|nr:class I SAM-dependent methyltransferase [Terriglobales bacterium]